jgi:cysteinyl-tRNA synthetase
LTIEGVKMSKSLNNFVSIQDALAKYRAQTIRFFILSGHYRSPLDYSEAALEGAARGWERLTGAYTAIQQRLSAPGPADVNTESSAASGLLEDVRQRFRAAMDDDFNAPAALSVLFDFTREVNTGLGSAKGPGRRDLELFAALYRELAGDVLGLLPENGGASAERESSLLRLLVELRKEARARKDFAISDAIRDRLAAMGVILEDGKDGTTWKIQ